MVGIYEKGRERSESRALVDDAGRCELCKLLLSLLARMPGDLAGRRPGSPVQCESMLVIETPLSTYARWPS